MNDLTLSAEYGCWPLWDRTSHSEPSENIEPESLPISQSLRSDLTAWGDEYEATLDQDYPPQSGFANETIAARWLRLGQELTGRLRDELPHSDWDLSYAHSGHQASAYVWRHMDAGSR